MPQLAMCLVAASNQLSRVEKPSRLVYKNENLQRQSGRFGVEQELNDAPIRSR